MKRRLIGALVVFLVLAAAGCQRGDGNENGVATADGAKSAGPSGTAERPAGDPAELARQFAQCMKEQGVEVEVETGDGDGIGIEIGGGSKDGDGSGSDPKQVEAAMEKCKQFAPNGGEPPKLDPAGVEEMRKVSQCMRENGLPNFPDPDSNGGIMIGPDSGVDFESDAFKAADQKCQQGRGPKAGGK
jgi:hypothetical protein